jgi:hypothetical protein
VALQRRTTSVDGAEAPLDIFVW